MSEVTTSFFYGGSSAPVQNTVDELIDTLNAKVQQADEDRVAAETAATQAAQSAAQASDAASSTSALAVQATETLDAANQAVANANEAVADAEAIAADIVQYVDDAQTAAADSQASAEVAQDWATKTSGPVAGGEYSSKYNAQQAATSATNASNSATAAASSASSASSSASTATTKASEASTSATNAASSATAAASSATSASSSATTATTKASEASTSATNAASSASSANSSATAATNSATSAASSASSASTSASTATTKASEAATSATNAASSASSASTSATNAADSAASASASASTATTQATNAANSATSAAGSATTATTKASEAASSATAAAGSATSASNSASSASTSATNAANSASSASTSATNAANSATAAAGYAASINPADLVHISGTETITGTKTFSSNPAISSGTANGVAYLNGSKVLTTGSAFVFDGGNLGLGVTPSAWWQYQKALQIVGGSISAYSLSSSNINVSANAYTNSSNVLTYITSDAATRYLQNAGAHVWYNAPSGTAGNAISFTQAMTLDASGNLNVTSPAFTDSIVTINATSTNVSQRLNFTANGTIQTQIYNDSSETRLNAVTSKPLAFRTANTERMRIDSSGNLLVGTSTTRAGKIVAEVGNSYAIEGYVNASGGVSFRGTYGVTSGTAYYGYWVYNGLNIGSIQSSGSTTAYVTTSDYRLKENIQPMQNALGVVAQLNPVTYTWKADGSDGQGFIAHELQAVVPDCVTGEKDAVDAEGKPVYQGIDTSFLVATLTKAIQEQQEQINQLKAEVASLKGA